MQKKNAETAIILSKQIIEQFISKHNRLPTAVEYDSMHGEGYSRRRLTQKTGLRWNEMLAEWFPAYSPNRNTYSKQDIIQALQKYYHSIDFVPTYADLRKNGLPSYAAIRTAFGVTYLELLESLGFRLKGTTTKSQSDEEMIQKFVDYYRRYGTAVSEHAHSTDIKCMSSYRSRFGNTRRVFETCGIDYCQVEKNSGAFGNRCANVHGEMCQSAIERDIDNFFIAQAINFEKEVKYSRFIAGCRYVLDWVVHTKETEWLVEYFGLYDAASHNSRIAVYTNKANRKVAILTQNGLAPRCIFVYPQDIASKSFQDIFSPFLSA